MNKYKLLVIEDDKSLRLVLKSYLETKGYIVDSCEDGTTGLEMCLSNKFDLILLDIGLPGLNGFSILQKVRQVNIDIPIIIITDKEEMDNEIETYKLGASLFNRKPINYQLLEFQLKSLLRNVSENTSYTLGELLVQPSLRKIERKGRNINLSFSEYKLLTYLISKKGLIDRYEIENRILSQNKLIISNAADALVARLRRKIGKFNGKDYIQTIYKRGYRLNPDIEVQMT
jgi:DNA-binding response OmpR family regulator